MSDKEKATRERIAQQIARYVESVEELKAMAEVRLECGLTEEEVYQSLCVARDKALRDSQKAINNDEYTLTEGDEKFQQNALRLKLAAYNILQNAVERHQQNHGMTEVDSDIVIGYEFELPEDKMTSDE